MSSRVMGEAEGCDELLFLVTSIAMLRERTSGTLERLMSMPLAKLDLLFGYGLAFALLAAVQATLTPAVAFGLLGVDADGAIWLLVLSGRRQRRPRNGARALPERVRDERVPGRSVHAGLRHPADPARRPARPRESMARLLELASDVLPLTYAYDALAQAAAGETGDRLALDVAVVCGFILLALALGATTLRRRTP